jgi:hypothetical protein
MTPCAVLYLVKVFIDFNKRTAEMVTALSALVISICALVVSVRQTRIMGEQQKLSAWPYVYHMVQSQIDETDSTGQFAVLLHNKGLGPAVIERLDIKMLDSVYEENQLDDALFRLLELKNIPHQRDSRYNPAADNIIPADDVIRLFEIEDKKLAFILAKEFNLLDRSQFDITIQYRNLYNTQWIVNGETPLQQRLKHVD